MFLDKEILPLSLSLSISILYMYNIENPFQESSPHILRNKKHVSRAVAAWHQMVSIALEREAIASLVDNIVGCRYMDV